MRSCLVLVGLLLGCVAWRALSSVGARRAVPGTVSLYLRGGALQSAAVATEPLHPAGDKVPSTDKADEGTPVAMPREPSAHSHESFGDSYPGGSVRGRDGVVLGVQVTMSQSDAGMLDGLADAAMGLLVAAGVTTDSGGNDAAVYLQDGHPPRRSAFVPVLPYPRNPRRAGVRGMVLLGALKDTGYRGTAHALVSLGVFPGTQQFRGASTQSTLLLDRFAATEGMLTMHTNDLVLGGLRPRPCHVTRCWWYEARWLLKPFAPPPVGLLGAVKTVADSAERAFHQVVEAILADLESPLGTVLPNSDGTATVEATENSRPQHALPWIISDPRMSFTLGHWLPHMADDDGRMRVVALLATRDPATTICAQLFGVKNKMNAQYIAALWEVQTVLALVLTSEMPRVFMDLNEAASSSAEARAAAAKKLMADLVAVDVSLGGDGSIGLGDWERSAVWASVSTTMNTRLATCSVPAAAMSAGIPKPRMDELTRLYERIVDGTAATWSREEAAAQLSQGTVDYFEKCVEDNLRGAAGDYCTPSSRVTANAQAADKTAQHEATGYEDNEALPDEQHSPSDRASLRMIVSDVALVGRPAADARATQRETRPLGWLGRDP